MKKYLYVCIHCTYTGTYTSGSQSVPLTLPTGTEAGWYHIVSNYNDNLGGNIYISREVLLCTDGQVCSESFGAGMCSTLFDWPTGK